MQYNEQVTLPTVKSIFANVLENASLKSILGIIAVSFNWVFASEKEGLMVILTLIAIDTFTGLIKAVKAKELKSGKFFRVLMKCFVYFILIATSALVDKVLPVKVCSTMTMTFLGITEGISIFENLGSSGAFPVIDLIMTSLKDKLKLKK